MSELEQTEAKPKNKGGRPPRLSPIEEVVKCVVGARASTRQRQEAFLEATARKWTLRQACGAAGVSRDVAQKWLADQRFAARYMNAQAAFLDAVEEMLIQQAMGRAGRVARASTQALQSFLNTYSAPFYRSRAEALLRQTTALQDVFVRILRRHVSQEVVEQVQADMARLGEAVEGSGGGRVR